MILDGTKNSVAPDEDSNDLLIASPPLKRRAIFIRPFGLGCFSLRAVVFQTDHLRHGKENLLPVWRYFRFAQLQQIVCFEFVVLQSASLRNAEAQRAEEKKPAVSTSGKRFKTKEKVPEQKRHSLSCAFLLS
jgi:hypothetical protein